VTLRHIVETNNFHGLSMNNSSIKPKTEKSGLIPFVILINDVDLQEVEVVGIILSKEEEVDNFLFM